MCDILIKNGTILTLDKDFHILSNGCICVSGSKITDVFQLDSNRPVPTAKKIIDATDTIVMPGIINTHTHLPMSIFRGIADDLPLKEWLENHIFPAEATFINPETVKIGTLLSCVEMISSGTTTCCDGYFFENEVAETISQTGLRTVLGQGIVDFPAPGVPNPLENVKYAVNFAKKWKNRNPLITPSIFCHSPYTCSEQTLKKAKAAANAEGIVFQIHVAETRGEREDMISRKNESPIRYLERIGVLDEKTLLVHAIWLDDNDLEVISRSGAGISVTTESEMKLASGIARVPDFLRQGIPCGLGTDGCASNNDLDMFSEMDVTAKLHKVISLDPTVANAREVLQMATVGGAKVLGMDEKIGSIEKGKEADLIAIDLSKPNLVPVYHPESHIVYAASGQDVKDVIIAGKIIMENRKIKHFQVNDLLIQAQKTAKEIRNHFN